MNENVEKEEKLSFGGMVCTVIVIASSILGLYVAFVAACTWILKKLTRLDGTFRHNLACKLDLLTVKEMADLEEKKDYPNE